MAHYAKGQGISAGLYVIGQLDKISHLRYLTDRQVGRLIKECLCENV
jgi:hypothetical protein